MAQQVSKSELTRSAWRQQKAASRPRKVGPKAAQVVLAWSSPDAEAGRCFAPVNLELEASSATSAGGTWRCRDLAGASWVEAISTAHCSEVMLTARVGDDVRARHLVLELAELLTQKLSATNPQIRVRFEPSRVQPAFNRARSA